MRVGVILSGCGFQDGAEIHESVLTLLALDRAGAEIACFAPDTAQTKVVNHLTGEEAGESRNVLVESARIARGEIADVKTADADTLDALILPGGFGAALNLCDFALKGPEADVNDDVANLVRAMHAAKKPIGAICIAPALIAKVLGKDGGPTLTIGTDAGTAGAIEACGADHQDCPVEDFVVDKEQRIVSTPAYMLGPTIKHVAEGIERCVAEVLALVEPANVA
ncbi:MAG: isoprenoid biosynthesis glyoxalase ElbB [Planctomycetota bacterium]|nr:isoprenoid biosynthesis glyoxalase ElbB [Planctomycetota bacterium]